MADRTLMDRLDDWNLATILENQYNKIFGKKKDTHKDTEMKEVNGDDDWERKKGKENDEYAVPPPPSQALARYHKCF
jgi:hypothetical protein